MSNQNIEDLSILSQKLKSQVQDCDNGAKGIYLIRFWFTIFYSWNHYNDNW